MSSLTILFVDSKNNVSFGDILWKTTFCIELFPDRRNPIKRIRGFSSSLDDDVAHSFPSNAT